MKRFTRIALSFIFFASVALAAEPSQRLQLNTRSRLETIQGSGEFQVLEKTVAWDPKKTAIVVCDMWDKHWCQGATERVAEMAPRMNEVLKAARQQGVFIIHSPSDTMKFYEGTPQRQLAQAAPVVTPKVPLQRWCSLDNSLEAPLPIDDTDGGCDDWPQCKTFTAWKRQIATLEVHEGDAVTDSAEAYYLMKQRGIDNVIVMGVHLNMCVLGRPFSIRQMVKQGKNVVLMRDLTDSLYNSRKRPYVDHFTGTDLMLEHVERYWCPTITSVAFLGGEPLRFSKDKRPHLVFMIGEDEYDTKTTLPLFAKQELEPRGLRCTLAHESASDPNGFAGLEALSDADLLVISVRRRTPSKAQMELIRRYLAAGKAVVGIRTASHAFGAKPKDDQHAGWDTFDVDVLGGSYQNHYNNKPPSGPATFVQVIAAAAAHPVLVGVPTNELRATSHLYKNRNLAPTVTPLLNGRLEGRPEVEPVAWVNTNQNRRVFYTSLGSPDDFKEPVFRRLLLNGILWAAQQPIPPAASPDAFAAMVGKDPPQVSASAPPAPVPNKYRKEWAKMKSIVPHGYVSHRTTEPVRIDGRLDDSAWQAASWTEDFADIEGGARPKPTYRTRAKMLWDDNYFYVAAQMDEPHVWGTLTNHDAVIFQDPDFEVFIDPDGDSHDYYEFEMNALNTGWDLIMKKAYKDGGPALNSWEIPGLKTAVHVLGTLNNPKDRDQGWSLEIAFPWKALGEFANRPVPPHEGDQWRVNFSRVQWQIKIINGQYQKVKGPKEDNWVWSPQGIIDMHRPEKWSYVQFTAKPAGIVKFIPDAAAPARAALQEMYYAQKDYQKQNGRWAANLAELGLKEDFAVGLSRRPILKANAAGFTATAEIQPAGGKAQRWHIRQDAKVWSE